MQNFRTINGIKNRLNKGEKLDDFIKFKGKIFMLVSYGNDEGGGVSSVYFSDVDNWNDYYKGNYSYTIKLYQTWKKVKENHYIQDKIIKIEEWEE